MAQPDPWRPEQFLCGATYMPAAVGPYLWHEFSPRQVEHDVAAMRREGIGLLRVLLSWDAFVPTHRGVDPRRLRDFETLLTVCHAQDVVVVPVLFAQTIGDSIMLPTYAIDRRRPRRGVRVVTDGIVQAGGPRDVWIDPLMLEVESLWLDAMLARFANHPAVAAWDLGHDPVTTARPRRTKHLEQWLELFAGSVHASGDRVWLTLDADDVLSARGSRLAVVAPHVDAAGLQLFGSRLGLAADGDPSGAVAFTVQLAQRMCGAATPLIVHTAYPTAREPGGTEEQPDDAAWDVELLDPRGVGRAVADDVAACADAGAAGMIASAWSDWSARTRGAPPADRFPSLTRCGLVDERGDPTPAGAEWFAQARRGRGCGPARPWPERLDGDDYFANLPGSARDLYATWRGQPR